MILKVTAVRDCKGEMYSAPRFNHTISEAEREFKLLANDGKSMMAQFPEDFDLFYLGEYDNLSGKFTSLATPTHICKAVTLKKQALEVQQ